MQTAALHALAQQMRMFCGRFVTKARKQRYIVQLIQRQKPRAHTIVNIVRVVGNFVSQVAQLGFQARLLLVQKPPSHAIRLLRFQALRILQRTMLEDAFPGFKREIEAVVGGVSLFQAIDHPQTLQVVLKPTKRLHAFVERILPRMAKRGMPQIMRQRNRLHQILIDLKRPGNGTPQLGNLQGMRQPRTKKVTFMVQEHLRLVDKAPERGGVNDAIAIPLVVRAGRSSHLRVQASFAVGRMTRKRGKIHGFALKRLLALIR